MASNKNDNNLLWKYAGLATQLFVALGLGVFVGIKIDEKLSFNTPVAVWVLPLLILSAIIYKVIKDTAPKK
jgi:hypothetical protein